MQSDARGPASALRSSFVVSCTSLIVVCASGAADWQTVLRHLASTAPIVKEALSGLLVFALAGVVVGLLWKWLAHLTGSHDAATALFTGLAFAAAATALFLQHRAIAGTRRDVVRTAEALERMAQAQAVQSALLEYQVGLASAQAEIDANQGVGRSARLGWIREARLEQDKTLRARLHQLGATEMLEQLPPPRKYS